uniref:Uncharacterized protein n=1 Tax=Panagrolaimus davidi TaxID=227884 RepID=A0A914QMG2_9BILA
MAAIKALIICLVLIALGDATRLFASRYHPKIISKDFENLSKNDVEEENVKLPRVCFWVMDIITHCIESE